MVMIKSIDLDVLHLILWGLAGILVGTALTMWINSSINSHIKGHEKNYFSISFLAFSAARIAVAGAVMFFAFHQSVYSGLAFLAAFLISRWIWLINKIRNHQSKG